MTAAWLSLLLLATWGSVLRWLWSRDIAARRAAETRASRLAERLAAAVAERDEAMDRAREWMAEADRLLVEQERHAAALPVGADRTRTSEVELMDPKRFDWLLDSLAKTESMLPYEDDRLAAKCLAEAFRDPERYKGSDAVRIIIVTGPDADPIGWELESIGLNLGEVRDLIGTINDHVDAILTEHRRQTPDPQVGCGGRDLP